MARRQTVLPLIYRLFFLIIEPALAIVGAYGAFFNQDGFLAMTDADSAVSPVPTSTGIIMSQLANLYLFFALNEAFILRSTGDINVWRTLFMVLLVADVGHLVTMAPRGVAIYYDFTQWSAVDWGNVPLVYVCASMRIAFLSGIGMSGAQAKVEGKSA